MSTEISNTSPVTTNVAINRIATQNQGELREIHRIHPSAEGTARNDRVSLTAAAEYLRRPDENNVKQSVIDTKRVEALREKITNSTYRVNAERVADKLLNFEYALSGVARKN